MNPPRRGLSVNLFLSRAAGRTGLGRLVAVALGALGPSWRAAPLRRLLQLAALAAFLHLLFLAAWPYDFAPGLLEARSWLPPEVFLWLDPLAGVATAVAGRAWNAALVGGVIVLAAGVLLPRAFCGYLCPLGTLIDGFDRLVARRAKSLHVRRPGRWRHARFYLLAGLLAAAACGVTLGGFVTPIPLLTRGLQFSAGRAHLGLAKNWGMVPPADAGLWLAVLLLAGVLLLGLLGRRFWCRFVCPSGAMLSLASLMRIGGRRVSGACVRCGRCADVCDFGAVTADFDVRPTDCTSCQTCGGACPTGAIRFAVGDRGGIDAPAAPPDAPDASAAPARASDARPLSRRGVLAAAVGGAAAAIATDPAVAGLGGPSPALLRPPGSVEERQFLQLCIRCGECFRVCPGSVLQPSQPANGLNALWTPVAVPAHAGCHQDCNFCTQVCPTGAIRPLSLEQKRRTHMGLAVIHARTCLPHAGRQDCRLCFEECEAAGYHAIEMRAIHLPVGDVPEGAFSQVELEDMGRILAPFVDPAACVGCGLCEYRCHSVNVRQRKLLDSSAVEVRPENQDRP